MSGSDCASLGQATKRSTRACWMPHSRPPPPWPRYRSERGQVKGKATDSYLLTPFDTTSRNTSLRGIDLRRCTVGPKNRRGRLLLVEAELPTADPSQHRVELRSDLGDALLHLRAHVARGSQIIGIDAMKQLARLCDQGLEFAVVGNVAKLEVRQEFDEVGNGRFLETEWLAIRPLLQPVGHVLDEL